MGRSIDKQQRMSSEAVGRFLTIPRVGGLVSKATRKPGSFVEQVVYVPSHLWARVEDICEQSTKEPSEVIADALRLMLSGGVPAAPASVGGTTPGTASSTEREDAPTAVDTTTSTEDLLAQLGDEPLESSDFRERLEEIMASVEKRDSLVERDSVTAAELARKMAQEHEMDATETTCVEISALVHDSGKLRVPESVLNKRAKLTLEEWSLVKQYPEFGAEILSDLTSLDDVALLVRSHQERWNGSGYPDGRAGEDIPLGAQIIDICDAYDILTSERAYRPALSPEIVRRTIESGAGHLWNPDLALVRLDKVLQD